MLWGRTGINSISSNSITTAVLNIPVVALNTLDVGKSNTGLTSGVGKELNSDLKLHVPIETSSNGDVVGERNSVATSKLTTLEGINDIVVRSYGSVVPSS